MSLSNETNTNGCPAYTIGWSIPSIYGEDAVKISDILIDGFLASSFIEIQFALYSLPFSTLYLPFLCTN